ncbi:MAG: permease [Dehalococcoidales bacterium]|nr:permease [Dehalococcoidales bacterium]
MDIVLDILLGGWNGLVSYLSAHVITCLVPALFIAGAISVFVSQAAILKYFGPQANKFQSYSIASVSGAILAVCSCTVLPLFAGIYKRGAGLGPAIAFLFSGPAINILAIVYSARLLGYDIGLARAVAAIAFAGIAGLIMALIYRKEESRADARAFAMMTADPGGKSIWLQVLFVGTLVVILVVTAAKIWIATGICVAILGIILWRWFSKDEVIQWLKETWHFTRLVVPWLLVGVFIAGILTVVIPQSFIVQFVGDNTLLSNLIASLFGALMYFATLTEVPIIRAFMDLGMDQGPALSLLMAGPALSLPSMLVIRKIIGTKKMLTYVGLVAVMATVTGYVFGLIG